MDTTIQHALAQLESTDDELRLAALNTLLSATDQPVDWAYELWDNLLAQLGDKDNHKRSIAAQMLSGLAKSDPEKRILRNFAAVAAVSRDPKFVTARHSLQSLWKIALGGAEQQQTTLQYLQDRYLTSLGEKNYTLIRYDIIESLRRLYDQTGEAAIKELALELIEAEDDLKYRKKYATLWKTPKAK